MLSLIHISDGYILDETAHDVTLRYDDNAPDVVVTTLKLVNVPTEPKLCLLYTSL